MPNLLIQFSKNGFDFSKDQTHKILNHFDYKHNYFFNKHIRMDIFDYNRSNVINFYEDNEIVIAHVGYFFFKDQEKITDDNLYIKQLVEKNIPIHSEIKSGKFIILYYHKQTNKFLLINDRFGLYPLFRYISEDVVIFSTEPKGIILSELTDKFKLNFTAISNYIKFNYPLGDSYFFQEIFSCSPSSILSISNLIFQKSTYFKEKWDFSIRKVKKPDLKKMIETFSEGIKLFYDKYNWNSVSSISGGYDSRFIYLNSPEIKDVITFDKDSKEYQIVLDTLKLKNAKLHILETRYNESSIEEIKQMNKISDGRSDIYYTQNYRLGKKIFELNKFDSVFDGFAGDAILGGNYLNFQKEFLRTFKIPVKYGPNDLDLTSFNFELVNGKFRELVIKNDNIKEFIQKYIDKHKEIRKSLMIFKWENRGRNWLIGGVNIQNKFIHSLFPFFYYPFFDEYSKFQLDQLKIKKLYTKLFKSINKDYNNLKDDFFRIKFKFPYYLRLISSVITYSLKSIGIIKEEKICDFKNQIIKPDLVELRNFIKSTLLASDIVNKDMIEIIFNDETKLKANFQFMMRLLNLTMVLKNYENKIIEV